MDNKDVMAELAKNGKKESQSVPEEMGNNGGPRADGKTERGKIDIKSDGSYVGEMAADTK